MQNQKAAIVTGGSRGIGRAIALALASQGVRVLVNYCGSEEKAAETVKLIQENGGEAASCRADVSDSAQVAALFEEALRLYGRVDILVNNAGITKDNLLMKMPEADFDAVIDTNLKGVFLCMKQASKLMIKQRSGRIINISSISGVIGNAGQANYCAAKAGVIGLTKSAAKELAPRGITVNAVAPGYIRTDMTASLSEAVTQSVMAQIPLKRLGEAEDIAAAAAFLASDQAGYITGQVLRVDGGLGM